MMITTLLLTSILFAFQAIESPTERQWRTPNEIADQITSITSSLEAVTVTTIGYSRNGLPIHCIEVAREHETPTTNRPALLLVAGIDGNHLLGTEVAMDIINTLVALPTEETSALLETHKLYVIPQVNPDAADFYFNPIKHERLRNITPSDNDHDGLLDEDGNEDLNGDGYITMMRVPDLENATHIANPDEPRLQIEPDPLKEQSASFILYTEGIDNDGDGKYNEDGLGGVDLNKNFMHGYKEHSDGAGHWQLSESESKALADFVLTHQEIAAIIVFGHHDTLSKPFTENGKDNAGAPKKLAEGDVELYKSISEKFVELTELKVAQQQNWDGSFVAWAYAQYGVPSFSTPLWTKPSIEKVAEGKPEETTYESENSPRGIGRGPGGHGGGRPSGGRQPNNSEENQADSANDSYLTPSGIGDISQETIDEMIAAAEAAGFPITDQMIQDITPEDIEMYAKMSGVQVRRVKNVKGNNKASSDDAKWLEYSDKQRDGKGFVEWSSFEHPQLGTVEIGGWVPYFKTLPPTNEIESITNKQALFIIDVANRLPKVRLNSPSIEKLSNGLWEVKVAVINDGWFPTGTEMAKKNKRARPIVLRLDVPNDTIVSGQKVQRIWSLSGGGTRKWFKWILQGQSNETINITLFSEKFGSKTISVSLKEKKGGDA